MRRPRRTLIAGDRFDRWTVLRRDPDKRCGWFCVCRCGRVKSVKSDSLSAGTSRSCGCLSAEMIVARSTKHGMAQRQNKSPEYITWMGMRSRCSGLAPADKKDYHDRGIMVCGRWQDFRNFIADMGPRPSGTSIDRIDNDGNYSCGKCEQCITNGWPANCRWTDCITQANNKTNNRNISLNGCTKNLSQWAASIGINPSSLSERLDKWNKEEALTTGKVFKYAKK